MRQRTIRSQTSASLLLIVMVTDGQQTPSTPFPTTHGVKTDGKKKRRQTSQHRLPEVQPEPQQKHTKDNTPVRTIFFKAEFLDNGEGVQTTPSDASINLLRRYSPKAAIFVGCAPLKARFRRKSVPKFIPGVGGAISHHPRDTVQRTGVARRMNGMIFRVLLRFSPPKTVTIQTGISTKQMWASFKWAPEAFP